MNGGFRLQMMNQHPVSSIGDNIIIRRKMKHSVSPDFLA